MANIDRLVGKWRIIHTEAWDRRHLDLCGPAYLMIDANGRGEMAFGALEASIDCGFTPNGIDFDWYGTDEGDQVAGNGWADLCDNGHIEGEISYQNSDENTFIAAPWPFQQPAKFVGILLLLSSPLATAEPLPPPDGTPSEIQANVEPMAFAAPPIIKSAFSRDEPFSICTTAIMSASSDCRG